MITCANGHANQVPGGTCSVCGLALPAPGMQVWGAPPQGGAAAPPPPPYATGAAPGPNPFATTPVPPPARTATPSRSRRPWIIVAAVVIAFVLAGGGAYLALTKPVPDVTGMAPSEARAELVDAGFADVTTTEEFSDSVPRGDVVSQDPGPGSRARSGQAVSIVVSRGEPKEVPSLAGERVSSATGAVSSLDLEVSTVSEPSDTVPEGVVISQEPSPGEILEEGDVVSLVVSSGPPYTTVTVTLDLFDVVIDDIFTDCSDAMTILQLYFRDSAIVDGSGRTLSTLAGLWEPKPGNGNYFPCEATGTFPRTSTQESNYRFLINPSEQSGGGIAYTRSEMEANGWRISLG